MTPLARRSPFLFAWALCGTLDILYAAVWSVLAGSDPGRMLRGVAKGPFGDGAADWPWWLSGTLYGVILYLVMNAIVLPLRFGAPFPPADLAKGAIALFPHIAFIGLPLAWLSMRQENDR